MDENWGEQMKGKMKGKNSEMISDMKTEMEDNEWDEEVNWRYEKWDEELKGQNIFITKFKSERNYAISENLNCICYTKLILFLVLETKVKVCLLMQINRCINQQEILLDYQICCRCNMHFCKIPLDLKTWSMN